MSRFEHIDVNDVLESLNEGDLNFACISTGAEFVETLLDPADGPSLLQLSESVALMSPRLGEGSTFEDGVKHAIEHAALSFEEARIAAPATESPMPLCHEVGRALCSLDIQAARRASRRVPETPDRLDYMRGVKAALQRITQASSIEVEQEQSYHADHVQRSSKGHATSAVLLGLVLRRKLRSELLTQLIDSGCTAEDSHDFISSAMEQKWIEHSGESLDPDDPVCRITHGGRTDLINRVREAIVD